LLLARPPPHRHLPSASLCRSPAPAEIYALSLHDALPICGVTEMAKIKIKQIGSPIRRPKAQKKILTGLGLGKMNKVVELEDTPEDRKSTRLNSSHVKISYAVFCLKKKSMGEGVPDADRAW